MSTLDSRFNRSDLEVLIEAIGDWEVLGNNEYHALQMVKSIPLPSEDHETYDYVVRLKEVFKSRERDILKSRTIRQEQAVFLKAKLMMARRDTGINQLFDMAAETSSAESKAVEDSSWDSLSSASADLPKKIKKEPKTNEAQKKLELAEFFIKDMGVWSYYEKFLEEKSQEQT